MVGPAVGLGMLVGCVGSMGGVVCCGGVVVGATGGGRHVMCACVVCGHWGCSGCGVWVKVVRWCQENGVPIKKWRRINGFVSVIKEALSSEKGEDCLPLGGW